MLCLRLFSMNSIHLIYIKLYRKQKVITLGKIQIFYADRRAVLCDTFEPSRAPTGKCAILQKVKLPFVYDFLKVDRAVCDEELVSAT